MAIVSYIGPKVVQKTCDVPFICCGILVSLKGGLEIFKDN